MMQNRRHLLNTSKCLLNHTIGCSRFVPNHEPIQEKDVLALAKFLADKPNILVLTGAGVSTESGDIEAHTHECQWTLDIKIIKSFVAQFF